MTVLPWQPLRWAAWPRACGKTRRLLEWWLEDPAGRVVIVTSDQEAARCRREAVALARDEPAAGRASAAVARTAVTTGIMAVARWQRRPTAGHGPKAMAFDDLHELIYALARVPPGWRVDWLAGTDEAGPLPPGIPADAACARLPRAAGERGRE